MASSRPQPIPTSPQQVGDPSSVVASSPVSRSSMSSTTSSLPSSSAPTLPSSSSSSSCCRCVPHGSYSLLVATLAVMGWMAALLQDGCDMAIVSGPVVQQLKPTFDENPIPYIEFGLEAYRDPATVTVPVPTDPAEEESGDGDGNGDGSDQATTTMVDPSQGICVEYPVGFSQDATWAAAQILDFAALVLGGGGAVFIWCSTCFVFSKVTWRWTGYEILLASLCQIGSFVWYRSHICDWNTCTLSYGSYLDMTAAVLWFMSALFIICWYPKPTITHDRIGVATNDYDSTELDLADDYEQGSGQPTTEMVRRYGDGIIDHDDNEEEEDGIIIDEGHDRISPMSKFPQAQIT